MVAWFVPAEKMGGGRETKGGKGERERERENHDCNHGANSENKKMLCLTCCIKEILNCTLF